MRGSSLREVGGKLVGYKFEILKWREPRYAA